MIDYRLVATALADVDTANFERFGQIFYGAVQDREFVPLGGMHDGGAEGFDSDTDPLFESAGAKNFLQVSKQKTTRKKIRDTVKRLREYGRNPEVVTYVTSETISDVDKEESVLTKELDCRVAIRDAKFIEAYINFNSSTVAAFNSFLLPSISYLLSPGESTLAKSGLSDTSHTLAVFLRQEVEHRDGSSSLLNSISDSLIIWSLRDTDPGKSIFMDRAQILAAIEEALPTSKTFIRNSIDDRLKALVMKSAPGGRQLRHYRNPDRYCLPYETRALVAVENADDDLLRLQVSCVFEDRLHAITNEDIDHLRADIVSICHTSLERVFERQGLKVAQFIRSDEVDDEVFTDVAQIVSEVVHETKKGLGDQELIRRLCLRILRRTFYMSSEPERIYLGKLSRTYVLLMLLRNEPRIVEYFSGMSAHFNLYIGSDIIIRALSELYLENESQTTINMLRILKDSGSNLILTEVTVQEVATHIRRQIFEFENVYANNEHRMTADLIEYVDRLLIRSYFYSRLSPADGVKAPKSWHAYISQFCNFNDIKKNIGDTELASYLMSKFKLDYEDTESSLLGIDPDELAALAEQIRAVKERGLGVKETDAILAYNDAVQVLRIYQVRKTGKEGKPGNPYGFKSWWLTQDGKVRRASKEVIQKSGGFAFMMRPEIILNYISLSPSLSEVRKSYRTIFPSVLGVRLSSGINDREFNNVMRTASELYELDDARAEAMVGALSIKLQGNVGKRFDTKW